MRTGPYTQQVRTCSGVQLLKDWGGCRSGQIRDNQLIHTNYWQTPNQETKFCYNCAMFLKPEDVINAAKLRPLSQGSNLILWKFNQDQKWYKIVDDIELARFFYQNLSGQNLSKVLLHEGEIEN